ncbi:MAG: hypothetical protein JXA24_03220 [Proteobacteria bacterium]|nr:hypothetical protein [Pseudomonadota bacterium]
MKRLAIAIALITMALAVPAKAFAANSGYDGGFFIASDDQEYLLKLTGRLQTKFYYQNSATQQKQLSFNIRRAQLNIFSELHDIVSMGFTLKHAITDVGTQNFQTVQVTGAFASIELIPQFVMTVGMVGLPLDMMSETSSAWYLLPEAPITNTQDDGISNLTPLRPSFGVPDGLGVNFSGGYWKWYYSLSFVNGSESNYVINPDMKMSFGFRTGFNILDPVPGKMTDFDCSETPKLTVNLGSMYQGKRTDPNTNADIKYLWTSSLGVGLRWGGFAFTTEGYYRRTSITSPGTTVVWSRPKLTDIGYYAAAGYYILPKKLEIAAQAGQIIRQGPDNDSWQFGGGFNYYIFENDLKLQAAYTLTTDFDDITGTQTNKIHNASLMLSSLF